VRGGVIGSIDTASISADAHFNRRALHSLNPTVVWITVALYPFQPAHNIPGAYPLIPAIGIELPYPGDKLFFCPHAVKRILGSVVARMPAVVAVRRQHITPLVGKGVPLRKSQARAYGYEKNTGY
jgi:hypothetical protein